MAPVKSPMLNFHYRYAPRHHKVFAFALSFLVVMPFCASEEMCSAVNTESYCHAAHAHRVGEPDLPGATRSVTYPGSYALIAPNSRVYANAPPGWLGNVTGAIVISPIIGSNFAMYIVHTTGPAEMPSNWAAGQGINKSRFIYLLHGAAEVISGAEENRTRLSVGGFVYIAPGDTSLRISCEEADTSFVLIDKTQKADTRTLGKSAFGNEKDKEEESVPGEVFKLRRLLSPGDSSLGFDIHIMDFAPGEYLNVREVHFNQHGLLLLEGQGIYRLNNDFFPVAAGDVLWMAPFVPQWFGALGRKRSRYLLYKDLQDDVLQKE